MLLLLCIPVFIIHNLISIMSTILQNILWLYHYSEYGEEWWESAVTYQYYDHGPISVIYIRDTAAGHLRLTDNNKRNVGCDIIWKKTKGH